MLRLNHQIFSAKILTSLRHILENGTFRRNLYAPATLGMTGYLELRDRVNGQFSGAIDRFKDKMKMFVEDKPENMIFTEDLRNMIHLAENKKADIELVIKMLKKFNSQDKEIRFGNFVFGPVVYRLFYHLQDADTALQCFKDSELEGMFNQLITYQLLMDLLYEKGRYEDVLNVFEIIRSRQTQGTKYARHIVVLTMAACYKLNTPKSLEFALQVMREIAEKNYMPMRKAAAFAAGLAIKQNAPHLALEIVCNQKDQQYYTVRNIKVLAYAGMDRADDALSILRTLLENDAPVSKGKRSVLREAVSKVGESINKNDRKDLEAKFNRIVKFLEDQGQISDNTLDEFLCAPISDTTYTSQQREKSNFNYRGDQQQHQQRRPPRRFGPNNSKEGLAELY